MPSPIGHAALALLAWPALRPLPKSPVRRAGLGASLLFALLAADVDLIPGFIRHGFTFPGHGGPTHSLLFGVGIALIFTVFARVFAPRPAWRLFVVGLAAAWSHPLLDALTPGHGPMLLWPLSSERFPVALNIFYGVQHSRPGVPPVTHAVTLINEVGFALLIACGYWLVRLWRSAPRRPLRESPA